jgi:inosine-uridine nucleoside N-ribohydrolase
MIDVSRRLSLPERPVVLISQTPLTDVANAYLLDPSVVDRLVVVAAMGSYTAPNAVMNAPNGDLDPWAGWIVAQRFRYVQVSAYYDQTGDVTAAQVSNLPQNALGAWMAAKQPNIYKSPKAADQVAGLAVALPAFAVAVQSAAPDTSAFDADQGTTLQPTVSGNAWIVSQIRPPLAASRLWQLLLDPHTFAP